MKINQLPVKSLVSAAVIAVMTSHAAYAGGFALYTESSGAAIGNYAAGIAAEAADASTAWYNPAGLVLLKKQEVLVSGVGVFPSTKLTGTSTFATPPLPSYVQTFSNLQGAKDAVVPAIHYALPLGESAAFGFSIVAPFGLSTDWGTDSPVRYAATKTELKTIDVSPDIAGKLNENISFGLGIDVQWADVTFNRDLGAPTLLQFMGMSPTLFDSTSDNKGSSVGFGFHTGLLGAFNDNHTRLGVNYQSRVSHRFHGSSTLTGRLTNLDFEPGVFRNDALQANDINLPDVLTLSAYQDINSRWAVLGSVVYTGWNTFNTIQLNNVAAFSTMVGPVIANSTTVEDYRDTWRLAAGANFHVNDKWMMRAGVGYDQTPTVDAHRDVRLPDANRWALSIGTHYQPTEALGVDVGYAYLFAANDPIVNNTIPLRSTAYYNVNATGKVNAQLVGAQIVWSVDKAATKAMK